MHSRRMQSLLSPHGVYSTADLDTALARVFGAGVRPLRLEESLFEAMVQGWRAQQAARFLKPKSILANEAGSPTGGAGSRGRCAPAPPVPLRVGRAGRTTILLVVVLHQLAQLAVLVHGQRAAADG